MKKKSIRVSRLGRRLILALAFSVGLGYLVTSCNVVRTITNKSEFTQKGDTAILIQTKTIEQYDASKNL